MLNQKLPTLFGNIYYWDIFTAVCVISIIPIGVSWKMFVNFEKLSIFRYLSNQTKLLAL